ncbi:response regulator transcription factor [Paenibacillus agricola]|uniref:Response regulator n=1 Tax=Paenibacillus agricola TaxID=2716264 RepID=A0ABX0J2W0_9BACL|nr:response regulator [Paenibacillus agricola]NHN30665.1 response regulator [Paenibacillus agricola]
MLENTLTVLVVDDELPLREELRLFPWSTCNAELVGEAENGEEALEFCHKLLPDVVITDITMPKMDGIELFRAIKKQFPLTQVILLTCHNDFEYVRDALRLGALEYLIKVSLLDSDLQQALDKARSTILREQSHQRSELDKQRWQLVKSFNRATSATADKQTSLQHATQEAQQIFDQWRLSFPLRVTQLHISTKAEDEIFVHHELQALFSQWEQTSKLSFRWVQLNKSTYLLLHQWVTDALQPMPVKIAQALQTIQAALEQRLSFISQAVRIYALLNNEITDFSVLFKALNETQINPAAIFYDSPGTVYEASTVAKALPNVMDEIEKQQHAKQFHSALARSQEALFRHIREDFTASMYAKRPDPEPLRAWSVAMCKELLKQGGYAADDKSVEKLTQARTLSELTAAFSHQLESAAGLKSKCRKEVQFAKQLISERLAEPITLTQIAEAVELSSYYLSRIFREEVGESFNEYVTSLRMDKAIQLLQTTNMKVYEVAEQVGIPSYRYFSVLFRNRTGVAPTDFKKIN